MPALNPGFIDAQFNSAHDDRGHHRAHQKQANAQSGSANPFGSLSAKQIARVQQLHRTDKQPIEGDRHQSGPQDERQAPQLVRGCAELLAQRT